LDRKVDAVIRVGQMGFGRAGRSVASVLLESKATRLEWVLRRSTALESRSVPEILGVTSDEPGLIHSSGTVSAAELLDRSPVDAIVDFSSESGIRYYGEEAARRGVTIVTAVSHYADETMEYLKRLARSTRVLCSPNITLGVNFLIIAARILRNIDPSADVEIVEEHFRSKLEISGTARKIAETLGVPDERIKSLRAGGIVGVHEVLFGFPYQTVRLKHESISREAFGNGALFALEHVHAMPNGFYLMEDLLIPYFRLDASEADLARESRRPWWHVWERGPRRARQSPLSLRRGRGEGTLRTGDAARTDETSSLENDAEAGEERSVTAGLR
jgi:4-hydroxy-tetrahydrodipicolinate reductase